MKTEYLDELTPTRLKEELYLLGVDLTDDQYRILLNRGRTFLYSHRVKRIRGNVLYRISYPLFFLWNLLLTLIVQPAKWVFTGNFYFKTDNPIYKITISWGRKIGI